MRFRSVVLLIAFATMAVAGRSPGWIGIGFTWTKGLRGHRALLVQRVAPDGPASHGGVLAGDLIVRINGRTVDAGDELDLLLFLNDRSPGESLAFDIVREGRQSKLMVRLGTMPESTRLAWKRNLSVARQNRLAAKAVPR